MSYSFSSSSMRSSFDVMNNEYESEDIHQIERKLFLRAALQLLDEKETNMNQGNNGNLSSSQTFPSTHRVSFRSDVIRFGKLKKANRRNALTSIASRVWKNKIVEIKYGVFYYEDEFISKSDLVENVWRKSIPLTGPSTTCRIVKVKGKHENCVFQLSSAGGAKRTFLASTPADRDAWMKAIFISMSTLDTSALLQSLNNGTINNVNGGLSQSPNSTHETRMDKLKQTTMNFFKSRASKQVGADQGETIDPYELLMQTSTTSSPGPAAKYAASITRFCIEQAKIGSSRSAEEFKQHILQLREQDTTLCIPVFFVKNMKTAAEDCNSSFAMTPEDALSSQMNSSLSSSQIWKDLQRDKLNINGELVIGQSRGGAEGMVAALTRHIMGVAQSTHKYQSPNGLGSPMGSPRTSETKKHMRHTPGKDNATTTTSTSTTTNGATNGSGSSTAAFLSKLTKKTNNSNNNSTTLNTSNHYLDHPEGSETGASAPLASNSFLLSEAHALACAKDVLVLCNRTQCGGDTYFCIESFLTKCGMDIITSNNKCGGERFCVLTPLETEADPMEIQVSVGHYTPGCEIKVFDSPPPPRINGNHHHHHHTGTATSANTMTSTLSSTATTNIEPPQSIANIRASIRRSQDMKAKFQKSNLTQETSNNYMTTTTTNNNNNNGNGDGSEVDDNRRSDTISSAGNTTVDTPNSSNNKLLSNTHSSSHNSAWFKKIQQQNQVFQGSEENSHMTRHLSFSLAVPTTVTPFSTTATGATSPTSPPALATSPSMLRMSQEEVKLLSRPPSDNCLLPSLHENDLRPVRSFSKSSENVLKLVRNNNNNNTEQHSDKDNDVSTTNTSSNNNSDKKLENNNHHHQQHHHQQQQQPHYHSSSNNMVGMEDDLFDREDVEEVMSLPDTDADVGTVFDDMVDDDDLLSNVSGEQEGGGGGHLTPPSYNYPELEEENSTLLSSEEMTINNNSNTDNDYYGPELLSKSQSAKLPYRSNSVVVGSGGVGGVDGGVRRRTASGSQRPVAITFTSKFPDTITTSNNNNNNTNNSGNGNGVLQYQYEVKPKQNSTLARFKPKNFKIFETAVTTSGNNNSNNNKDNHSIHSNNSSNSNNSHNQGGTTNSTTTTTNTATNNAAHNLPMTRQHASESFQEFINKRKNSLSAIYETQLAFLSQQQQQQQQQQPNSPLKPSTSPSTTYSNNNNHNLSNATSTFMAATAAASSEMVLNVVVRAESKYRVCCCDPQGDESDNWATVTAIFQQNFLLHADAQGAPTSLDRTVTLHFEKDIRRTTS